MLTKAQTLLAIQKSLIKYNEIVATQIDSKISAHNTVATTTAPGHMSAAMVNKLNGIAEGAEVNVQADWNVTDSTKDAFIKNKPAIPKIDSTFSASSTNAAQSKVIATWVNGQISTEIGKLTETEVTDAEITTMIAAVQAEVIK